jgi:RNA polymerase sigma factor (sigma-70 family)
MDHELDEYELALRARGGDPEALVELVERTRLRLFALAYADLRHYEDAQDAVAAALLQICLHIRELREPERVRAWMQSIVRNEVRRLRRAAGVPTLSLDEADLPEDNSRLWLLRLDIERAMRQLPDDQAAVSRLFYLDDLSIPEIAARTGRPAGTIKSWLHRGRRRLALEMEAYAPMETIPTPAAAEKAVLVHTDLPPAALHTVIQALQAGGYTAQVLTPGDPSKLLDSLAEYQAVVLDERIGGHPALHFVMHIRSRPDIRELPVIVLSSDPTEFTAFACFAARVDRLVDKRSPEELARLAGRLGHPRYARDAGRVTMRAAKEAGALGQHFVGTEHLLLALTQERESTGAQVLARLGITVERVREEVLKRAPRGPGNTLNYQQATPELMKVWDLAHGEASLLQNGRLRVEVGTEHLLLGMLHEGEGLAAQVLSKLGADLDGVRREVRTAPVSD